jgi:molecular chaperone DnaK
MDMCLAVLDLGGGTCDLSVILAKNRILEVLAANGGAGQGGEEFDQLLARGLAGELGEKRGADTRRPPRGDPARRLWEAAERARIELSHIRKTGLDYPPGRDPGPAGLELSRLKLELLVKEASDRAPDLVRATFPDAGPTLFDEREEFYPRQTGGRAPGVSSPRPSSLKSPPRRGRPGPPLHMIGEFFLAGGMARPPLAAGAVLEIIGRKPVLPGEPADVAVLGAALLAALGEERLLDVAPAALDLDDGDDSKLVRKNSSMPSRGEGTVVVVGDSRGKASFRILQEGGWCYGDKRPLASYGLGGLHSGGVEAEVELDALGGVKVSARDAETGRRLPLKVREPERPSAPARPKPLVPDCELQEDGPGDLGSLARDLLPAPESLRPAFSRPPGRSPEVSRLREAARKTLKILEEALAASGLPGTAPPVGEPAGPAPSLVPPPPPSPGGGIPEDCPGFLESLVRDASPALDSLRLVLSRPE